jgi:hypothetical protein
MIKPYLTSQFRHFDRSELRNIKNNLRFSVNVTNIYNINRPTIKYCHYLQAGANRFDK